MEINKADALSKQVAKWSLEIETIIYNKEIQMKTEFKKKTPIHQLQRQQSHNLSPKNGTL